MQVRVRGLGSLTRRAAGPEMVMARWPMVALLSSVALYLAIFFHIER